MKANEGRIMIATVAVFVAAKLQAEHLAKLSPERSPKQWEEHFRQEALAIVTSVPPEQLNSYIEQRFPR
jgi:hypothetical protein